MIGPSGVATAAVGGGGFTPASLPNLLAWYKADVGVTHTGNGTAATAWADQSGNGYHLATAGSSPTYLSAGLNGKQALQFTAASVNVLVTATGVAMGTGSANSGFFVGTYTASTLNFGRGILYAPAAGNDIDSGATIWADKNGANAELWGFNSGNGGTPLAVALSTVVHYGNVISGTSITAYLEGVGQTPATIASAVNVNGGLISVGTQIQVGVPAAAAWDGLFSEIVITKDAMTAPNIALLETYFARWD